MAICEKCGTRYTATAQAPGCPACAAAKKSRPRSVSAAGPSQSKAASTAQPGPTRPSAAPAPAARKVHPSSGTAPRTRPRAPEPPPPPVQIHVQRGPKPTMDKATKIGFYITLGLALIVGIVVFKVMGTKEEERAVIQAREQAVKDLVAELNAYNVDKPSDAEKIVARAVEKESIWKNHEAATAIQTLMVRAKTNIESNKEQQSVIDSFTSIEKELAAPDGLAPERVKDLRRQLDELEVKVAQAGPEILARFSITRGTADKTYATRLLDDAKTFETANADNPRLSLLRYQTAEDEIKLLLDRSYRDKITELQEFYTPLYKQVILESDRLATEIFTDAAASDKLPWIDCLTGDQAALWNPSDAKGFSHKVENHQLLIQGPDADAGKMAVMSIGDREQWRNFAWEFEVVIEKGNLDVYFRLGKVPNLNTYKYAMSTAGEDRNLSPGKTYRGRATILGSKFDIRYADEDIDTPTPQTLDIGWTMSRKGAIGLVIPSGTTIKFTRFQVRELR